MEIKDLLGKLVAVLGYGVEGKAVTKYLIKHGVKPVLFDQKPWEEWGTNEQTAIKALEINFIFGPDAFLELKGFDVAFRSPGVRIEDVEAASGRHNLKMEADGLRYRANLTLTSQTKWFFDNCPAKIIGATGTKGKGTTSVLIYEMLKTGIILSPNEAEHLGFKKTDSSDALGMTPRVFLTGNIGYTQPLDILDDLKNDDGVVYELSSFQLQDLGKSPHIGVVLMVTSEHLDYHRDNQEYITAKEAIVKYQKADDVAIINADFETSIEIGKLGKGKKLYFSRKSVLDEGCYVKGYQVIFVGKLAGDPSLQRLAFDISNIQLRGAHNLENICAAILAAKLAGCDDSAIQSVVNNFKGLEHRLEFVAEKHGIKFYNDSFSTTPETAIAAIESFNEPLIVILGGSPKNSDFSELGKTIKSSQNLKAVILVGQETEKIKAVINMPSPQKIKLYEGAKTMTEIFSQVKLVVEAGDVVLLSPACASFGMFKNYKDRGEQFKLSVEQFG